MFIYYFRNLQIFKIDQERQNEATLQHIDYFKQKVKLYLCENVAFLKLFYSRCIPQ